MIQLLKIEKNIIKLNTNMTPEVFARTGFSEKLKEKGVLAEFKNNSWEYNPWTFDETAEENGNLILKGTAFENAENSITYKTAAEILENGTQEEIKNLSLTLCQVLEDVIKSKVPVTNIGGGGIIVSEDLTKIIFMPYNFWTTAVMSCGDETFSTVNGFYINQNLNRENSIRWTQAVFVYKAITGKFPFENKDTKKRSEDYIDGNYSLLKWTVPGVNKKITDFTENAFAVKAAEFPAEEFASYKKTDFSQEELLKFQKEAEAAAAKKNKKVQSKRFVRAKKTVIIVCSITAALALITASYIRKTSLDKPTSKGLTALQTVEMYYNAVNELNVDAMQNCTKNLSGRVDEISNIFLKSKTRSMYDRTSDTVTPAAWLIKNQTRHNIYGLSQFYIDGKEGTLLTEGPKKNTKPEAVTEENGVQLKDGDKKTFKVQYIILDTTGEDLLAAYKTQDQLELTYDKDRWVVSSIDTVSDAAEFKMSEYAQDYLACMKAESHEKADVLAACQCLKEKYFFISTEHEIDEGYEYLKKISVFNLD